VRWRRGSVKLFRLGSRQTHLKGSTMHWTAVVLAAYAAGFLEFWRLCDAAPAAKDEAVDAA